MQSLKLNEMSEDEAPIEGEIYGPVTSRRGQFQLEPTIGQKKFDWIFGVGLPLVCVAADPIVFSSKDGFGRPLLGEYQTFAYILSSVSILSMAAWLLWGQRLGGVRPYLGGLFLAGSIVSLVVGIILLPFSLLGMFMMIGILGFTPLLSSFVYFRNGIRAIDGAKLDLPPDLIYRAVIIAVLYSLIVPFVLNF